jgi:hypothetical protein
VSGQPHALAALIAGINWGVGGVGPRTGVDATRREKVISTVQPVLTELPRGAVMLIRQCAVSVPRKYIRPLQILYQVIYSD